MPVRNTFRLAAAFASLAFAGAAHADPPALRAQSSLATGLRVEACNAAGRCQTWVQFAPRPYRTFVEAQRSPSGRHFYVWSKPDDGPRELDVFATPPREGELAVRRGHWSPGAGGELAWVAGDRLWHTWGCGTSCEIAQLYDVHGTTLTSLSGWSAVLSPDRRFAIVAATHDGTLVDLSRASLRSFPAPAGTRFGLHVRWSARDAAVSFVSESPDAAPRERRQVVRVPLAPRAPVVRLARLTPH